MDEKNTRTRSKGEVTVVWKPSSGALLLALDRDPAPMGS
jgi:hypothetical protein